MKALQSDKFKELRKKDRKAIQKLVAGHSVVDINGTRYRLRSTSDEAVEEKKLEAAS